MNENLKFLETRWYVKNQFFNFTSGFQWLQIINTWKYLKRNILLNSILKVGSVFFLSFYVFIFKGSLESFKRKVMLKLLSAKKCGRNCSTDHEFKCQNVIWFPFLCIYLCWLISSCDCCSSFHITVPLVNLILMTLWTPWRKSFCICVGMTYLHFR